MDLLAQYGGDEEDDVPVPLMPSVNCAPDVNTAGLTIVQAGGQALVVPLASTKNLHDPNSRMVYHNPKYEELHAPVAGPVHPLHHGGHVVTHKNLPTGFVERSHMGEFAFAEQHNTFHAYGFSQEPSGQGFVGQTYALGNVGGETVYTQRGSERKRKNAELFGAVVAAEGASEELTPWSAAVGLKQKPLQNHTADLSDTQKEYVEWHNARRDARRRKPTEDEALKEKNKEAEEDSGATARTEKTMFHGKEEHDALGKSWIEAPKDKKKENETCFLPKRWIHTWSGHSKGVAAIRFFPKSGHLLLSAGMDTKIKIWDVHGSGKCMRTYLGHEQAVKDICFSNDGRRFVSTSFDKQVKLWDTETGQVITAVSTGKVAHCGKLHPDDDKQHIVLCGQSDKKIVQWDLNTRDIVQEYDQHLAAVNSVTFIDEGRRFVTSSDDKTLRAWEYGIPVVIKYIADPAMQSMPSIAVHPNNQWFAAQSMDNQIMIYGCKERIRLNSKKRFTGHSNAGYACQVNFSPDGHYVLSGDAEGRLFIWDWKSSRIYRTIKAHDQVCIGVEWHPLESSKVATCSWDGTIKYWD